VELEIAREYPKGEMRCPVHLSVGQELTSAIFSIFQTRGDYAVSTHRAHAHYLAKNGDLNRMIAEIYGKATGCSLGRGGSMHLSDPSVRFMGSSAIVGNSIPVGVGIAYGVKTRREKDIIFVFLGDGATEEGVFYESLNFVAIHKLPVIFICENNLYSVYSDLSARQPSGRSISEVVKAIGIDSFKISFGEDRPLFETLQKYTKSEIKGTPCFIEIETYRWLEHCGPENDDALGYRTKEELDNFKFFDYVEHVKTRLLRYGFASEINRVEAQVQNDIMNAFDFARKSPFPNRSQTYGDFNSLEFR
jgi:pyruvate dehydrogenase E1 component alpha subunit